MIILRVVPLLDENLQMIFTKSVFQAGFPTEKHRRIEQSEPAL
jgi:hypothetical protein